jgi:hypothetical protein
MISRPTRSRVIMPAAITGRDSTAPRPAGNNTATMGESRIYAQASSRPMLCEQESPITVPNVPEMNMQTQLPRSAWGHFQTSGGVRARSVHPSTADTQRPQRHIRYVPQAEVSLPNPAGTLAYKRTQMRHNSF